MLTPHTAESTYTHTHTGSTRTRPGVCLISACVSVSGTCRSDVIAVVFLHTQTHTFNQGHVELIQHAEVDLLMLHRTFYAPFLPVLTVVFCVHCSVSVCVTAWTGCHFSWLQEQLWVGDGYCLAFFRPTSAAQHSAK